jgi:hypothetical protein
MFLSLQLAVIYAARVDLPPLLGLTGFTVVGGNFTNCSLRNIYKHPVCITKEIKKRLICYSKKHTMSSHQLKYTNGGFLASWKAREIKVLDYKR